MGPSNKRKKGKKKTAKSLYGPINGTSKNHNKPAPRKASTHAYKRHPHAHFSSTKKKQHYVHLNKRHIRKETRIPVQQLKFTLRLPIVNTGKHARTSVKIKDMPWYSSDSNDGTTQQQEQQQQQQQQYSSASSIAPLKHVSNQNLSRLDEELLQFAAYVRLTPKEQDAREFIIQHVTSICQSTFQKKGRQQQQEPEIRLEAFGSYATPAVCTFMSDVDLALYGVVPVAKHTVFHTNHDNGEASSLQHDEQPDEKEDRVQKWKEALAELDAQERSDDEIVQQQQREKKDTATKSGAGDGTSDGTTVVDLTVDTTNDNVGDSKQQQQKENATATDTASDTAAADATANDDDNKEPQQQATVQPDCLFVIDREGDDLASSVEEEKKEESEAIMVQAEAVTRSNTVAESATTLSALTQQRQAESRDERVAASRPSLDSADGSAEAPLEVDDSESDVNGNNVQSDSEDDSADKLESYRHNKRASIHSAMAYRENRANMAAAKQDSDSDSDEDEAHQQFDDAEHDDDFQVSIVSHASLDTKPAAAAAPPTGPTGETRKLVVGALKALGKALWKSPVIHTVEVRRHARVPIIATGTHLGFQGDIAIGGHNGTDTSQYAASQARRFKSFAPVVLLLKILLVQQSLDKPFTGGLGSYKLYVLVAHHLEQHLAMGGVDRPSEVLAAFFFRFRKFRDKRNHHNSTTSHETLLSLHKVIRCADGSADLQSVFKLQHCCDLFSESWSRLLRQLESNDATTSFLVKLLHHSVLRQERDQNRNKASNVEQYFQQSKRPPAFLQGWQERQSGGARNQNQQGKAKNGSPAKRKRAPPSPVEENMFSNNGEAAPPTELTQIWQKRWQQKEHAGSNPNQQAGRKRSPPDARPIEGDAEAAQLMAGYGMKRGPHGGLIPRSRPDVEARQSMPSIPEAVGRATKNRKNKKKQKRDEGLKEIAVASATGGHLSRRERQRLRKEQLQAEAKSSQKKPKRRSSRLKRGDALL